MLQGKGRASPIYRSIILEWPLMCFISSHPIGIASTVFISPNHSARQKIINYKLTTTRNIFLTGTVITEHEMILLYLSGLNMMEGILTKNNQLRFPPKPKEAKLNITGDDIFWILPTRSSSNHSLNNICKFAIITSLKKNRSCTDF